MSNIKRYIVGHRHGPRMDPQSQERLEKLLSEKPAAKELRRTSVGRLSLSLAEDRMRDFQRDNPNLVVEEDQPLQLFGMPGLPACAPTNDTRPLPVSVRVDGGKKPIAHATVYGFGQSVRYKAVTDAKGEAVLQVGESYLNQVMVSARDTYWSQRVESIKVDAKTKLAIGLKPLLSNGCQDWAKLAMGFHVVNEVYTGKGVKVAVLDTGVSNAHNDLQIAGGYNTLDGKAADKWDVDEKGHGTHIAGVLGAKPEARNFVGGAPNAELYSVKVFPGGYISDLVEGIEWCIRNNMDVICLSLGIPAPSHVLASALRDAYDRGITCVAATGNDRSHVAIPAAYPTTIAVGALGRLGTFPEDSGHMLSVSQTTDMRGGMFAATFSNFGPSVDVCAPGVSILSTVPTGYAAWDGTSMACATVCAVVALILEAYPQLRTADPAQPEAVRSILHQSAYDLGMPPYIQGAGLPLCPHALSAGVYQQGGQCAS
jgi:Subtilase family